MANLVGEGVVGHPGIFGAGGEIEEVVIGKFQVDVASRGDGN